MKKILALVLLITATFFGTATAGDGIITAGATDTQTCTETVNDGIITAGVGIITAGLTGIITAGLTGIITAGATSDTQTNCGIITAGATDGV